MGRNACTLALAALVLAAGRLADALGSRRIFLWGLTVFTATSLAAGLAPTGLLLIGARVLPGGGAALMMPATLAIVSSTFPPRQRGMRSASGPASPPAISPSAHSSAPS